MFRGRFPMEAWTETATGNRGRFHAPNPAPGEPRDIQDM